MHIIEQYTAAKSTTTPSEDAVVVNAYYAAVIDGATPKTSFRFAGGETPGHRAAQLIADAITSLPPAADAPEAVALISASMRDGVDFEQLQASNRPIASVAIYSAARNEVWMIGDCQLFLPELNEAYCENKVIDRLLSEWRRDIDRSMLSRGLLTEDEIREKDPGRAIIQHFITQQVRYQNRKDGHRLAYVMLDGSSIDQQQIRVFPIPRGCHRLVLATDGYPKLFGTLEQTERHLAQLLQEDPLCIGPLLGTKGISPGNNSFDDRSYLSIEL